MARWFETLDDFRSNLHRDGYGLVDFDGNKIPCIYVTPRKYDEFMTKVCGKKIAVDTLLNIFHDGYHVFVDVQMKFLDIGLQENYLFYANDMLDFFEALSNRGLLSLAPNGLCNYDNQNIFIIQLPRIESAKKALDIIKIKSKT